ncbi:hypothetical protein PCANB_000946 [Pneumocystis canis]|nr:hypothetical protein PCANB_000946 [Pneumocystis canis]
MTYGSTNIFSPIFDLNSYIDNYKDYTRIERLIFISKHSSSLSVEALKLAVKLSQLETLNTVLYKKLITILQKKCPDENIVILDAYWITKTNENIKIEQEKLKFNLEIYKNNLIKDSIRMGYNDLGKHYYACRDLDNSLKFYSEASKYSTTSKHTIDALLNIIKILLEQKRFSDIQSQLIKIQNMSCKDEIISRIQAISGLVHFNLKNYKEAALTLCMIKTEMSKEFNDIISVDDIVIYATLCALSSFSRSELKQYIINNTKFKKIFDTESQILETATSFYLSNYSKCFNILNRLKNNFMIDIYLNKHADNLLLSIRQRAYIFYLKPFSYVDLKRMAEVFSFLLENMEKELIQLILESKIYAKIDNIKKFLIIIEPNQHDMIYKKILKINDEYKKAIKLSLIHMDLLKEGLEVKSICNSDINIEIENK